MRDSGDRITREMCTKVSRKVGLFAIAWMQKSKGVSLWSESSGDVLLRSKEAECFRLRLTWLTLGYFFVRLLTLIHVHKKREI
jgi:preprotein translocase subunit SecG